MKDKNIFFREATLAICGHLDIETSMQATFTTLQKWMPLDRMYVELYEPAVGHASGTVLYRFIQRPETQEYSSTQEPFGR